MNKEILGHINCPACGTANGMRITHDKNKHPFGFCEAECGQQLRVGGNPRRVAAFVARFPWAGIPVTGTVTGSTEPKAAPAPATPAPVAAPAPAPKPAAKAPAKAAPPTAPAAAPKAASWFSTVMGVPNA